MISIDFYTKPNCIACSLTLQALIDYCKNKNVKLNVISDNNDIKYFPTSFIYNDSNFIKKVVGDKIIDKIKEYV